MKCLELFTTRLWLWYSRSNCLNWDRVAFMNSVLEWEQFGLKQRVDETGTAGGVYEGSRSSSMRRVLGRQSRGWLELLVLWLFRLSMDSDDPEEMWRQVDVNEGECSLQVWTDLTELIFLMILWGLWLKLVLQASWAYIWIFFNYICYKMLDQIVKYLSWTYSMKMLHYFW